ncbi:hypothetical protein B0T24DRAFT_118211 [Lasiosphaeria ovina]|uniref:Uncharacterized protein n=1 Tax=Lasiosphaeria ovina TaxID=92902 RepID=A0AAE0JTE1_9PEZI|nr:hypothetical protein B0T24DRAFT_118211 [Lasiosphaeria ovina]
MYVSTKSVPSFHLGTQSAFPRFLNHTSHARAQWYIFLGDVHPGFSFGEPPEQLHSQRPSHGTRPAWLASRLGPSLQHQTTENAPVRSVGRHLPLWSADLCFQDGRNAFAQNNTGEPEFTKSRLNLGWDGSQDQTLPNDATLAFIRSLPSMQSTYLPGKQRCRSDLPPDYVQYPTQEGQKDLNIITIKKLDHGHKTRKKNNCGPPIAKWYLKIRTHNLDY